MYYAHDIPFKLVDLLNRLLRFRMRLTESVHEWLLFSSLFFSLSTGDAAKTFDRFIISVLPVML